MVETGAGVPGDSGGLAGLLVVSDAGFSSSVAGGADPGSGAERGSERLFGEELDSNRCVRIGGLKDVA